MSSLLRTIRAFSTELQKIAAKGQYPLDPEIHRLLSERKGVEYQEGGRLLSNSMMEGNEYAQKMAAYSRMTNPAGFARGSGAMGVLDSDTNNPTAYQHTRDYLGTAARGGLTGLGVLGAYNAMRGHFGAPQGAAAIARAAKSARTAAGVGAGVAVADRAYRHHNQAKMKHAFIVSPNPNTSFRSPAASLAQSGSTGSLKSSVTHDTGKVSKPFQMGQKFRLPGA